MRKFIIAIFALVIIGQNVKAQTVEEKVAAAVEFLKQAMISGNQNDLETITSTNLSYGHSGGKIEDKAAFVKSLAGGTSDFLTMDLTDQTIKTTGKVAVVRHKLFAKTNDNGKPSDVKLGVMLVFVKEGKDWKLLGRQAYKL